MKFLQYTALLVLPLTLAACSVGGPSEEELQEQMAAAAQIGQAQAIATIIDRSIAEPCQPINLYNNVDEANKKEVNLINVACESLNLPDIPATTEPAAEAQTAENAAEAAPETTDTE